MHSLLPPTTLLRTPFVLHSTDRSYLYARLHRRSIRDVVRVRIKHDEVLARDYAGHVREVIRGIEPQPEPPGSRELVKLGTLHNVSPSQAQTSSYDVATLYYVERRGL